ncbi:MAG TPA: TrbI/VirB10 family protein [Oligoflexia bacterium]|nr:TrbI/VirB10 family protein [Oligoflexia bacterium]HMP49612.1 TrbI/VirB10 family protein [Oligoflexia bacterium]
MNQKLEDLKTIVKSDKRIMAGLAFLVVVVLFLLLSSDQKGSRPIRPKPVGNATKQGMSAEEQFTDLIIAFKNDIESQKKQSAELSAQINRTEKDAENFRQKTSGIFETLMDTVEQVQRDLDQLASAVNRGNSDVAIQPPPQVEGPDDIVPEWFDEKDAVGRPPEPRPLRVSVIAPGDSVPVELLTGVNAPTDGTPYPVVFKLGGAITGPDGSALDLGEGRLIAAAQGSESDSRALFRLTQLSLRHPSGRRSVIDVDGWIIGEDGIRGMQGRLEDKLGRLILATAVISGVAAMGQQLQRNTRVFFGNNRFDQPGFTLQSQDLEFAAASAVTDASNRLGQVLLRRYEALVPVVEVLSGREAVAIFSKPAEVAVLDEDTIYTASYSGID